MQNPFKKKIKFEKTSQYAIIPQRGTKLSSGIDFFSPKNYTIKARSDALIPLDLKCILPKGYDLVVHNKSGVSTKKKLVVGAHVIDNDYRGIIHVHLFNLSDVDVTIMPKDKIAQGILRKVEFADCIEVETGTIVPDTERGNGGFGSTGATLREKAA